MLLGCDVKFKLEEQILREEREYLSDQHQRQRLVINFVNIDVGWHSQRGCGRIGWRVTILINMLYIMLSVGALAHQLR